MEMTSSDQRRLVEESRREHVQRLLENYPDIGADERAEIIRFLKKGSPLDVGLLSSNDAVKPQLARFRRDHQAEFAIGLKGLAAALALIGLFVLACVLLWDSGVSR